VALPSTASFPQSDSIISRWYLDEESGTRDDAVTTNDLSDNNTVTYAAGQFSANAASFASANQEWLSKTDTASLSITGDLTFSVLLKPASQEAYMGIFGKHLTTGNQRGIYCFYFDSDGTRYVTLGISSNGSNDSSVLWATTLSNATWYHLTISYDASAGSATLYIDGEKVSTETGLYTSIYNNSADFVLGHYRSAGGTNGWNGLIQDAVIWGYALSDAEAGDQHDAYYATPAGVWVPRIITF